ncbi:uncharacterized protein BKA55DRAFT_593131 [Fusarium redolens]|uniref:Uncharacterized protein n=1 Tax=Fusarium redolens TaxID=48865 RepID=A0A9P9HFD0_FUSRE|nr:uncharacterized protein BKA55DRAFT_593131 [Fusarium redolens]KAH7255923.1 hypothetical protein BKA55DRAFT_593131 [Fusarium redolens]
MADTITTTSTAKPRRKSREPRDTGFPEPLNNVRNTTLPHPDADLSPNACLTQEDIDPDRALMRTRRSFLRKKRRTLNHGRITPTSEALYSVFSLVQSDVGDNESIRAGNPSMNSFRPSTSSIRLSKDETDSLASRTTRRDEEDTPPTSPDVPTHRSKKGFMSKFRRG